ncbi:MAG TPA: amidohydrolase family protein [bacterium]
MTIIDFHTHIGDIINGFDVVVDPSGKPFKLFEFLYQKMGFQSPLPGTEPKWMRIPLAIEVQLRSAWGTQTRLLESIGQNEISAAVVHPIEPKSDTAKIFNDAKAHKNLFVFASVDPKSSQRINKLREYMAMGCRGLKLHPIIQRTSPEDIAYFEIIEEYQKYGKPVLFHTGKFDYYIPRTRSTEYGRVELFEKIISSFPKVNFVLGHTGLHTPGPAIVLAERYKNVYLETSFQSKKSLKSIFARVDHSHILFGSDWPCSFQAPHLKIMKKATAANPSLAERVFYRNAETLLGHQVI